MYQVDHPQPPSIKHTPISQRWTDFSATERRYQYLLHVHAQSFLRLYVKGEFLLQKLKRINRFDVYHEIPVGHFSEDEEIPYHEGFRTNVLPFLQRYHWLFQVPRDERIPIEPHHFGYFEIMNAAYLAEEHMLEVLNEYGELPDMPQCPFTGDNPPRV